MSDLNNDYMRMMSFLVTCSYVYHFCPTNMAINLLLIATFRPLAADHHQAT